MEINPKQKSPSSSPGMKYSAGHDNSFFIKGPKSFKVVAKSKKLVAIFSRKGHFSP